MTAAMDELLGILDLEQLEHNLYRGRSPKLDWQRVFGGQTIAQALVAAQRTVEPERHVHSLHGYFMRPGDTKVPIIYQVDRIRDGGSSPRAVSWLSSTARRSFRWKPRSSRKRSGSSIRWRCRRTCRRPTHCCRSAN